MSYTANVLHGYVLCIDCQCQVDCTVHYVDSGCLVPSERFGERDIAAKEERKKSTTYKYTRITEIDAHAHDTETETGASKSVQQQRPNGNLNAN